MAMAGSDSVRAGIRRCPALHLGLRVDRTRHARADGSPAALVAVGFYRYVRNPMYVGFAAGWIGLWIVFGKADPAVIASVAAVALGVHLFVLLYEEPTLRGKFGEDYELYRRNVRRWWPRLRPWDKPR
jgi:protein-S-isoprenylcysteine O-methyltransferase Ste14